MAVPGAAPGFVMASFANSALNDHLVNFVLCAVPGAGEDRVGKRRH